MKIVSIPKSWVSVAKKRATKMGRLRNSIMKGERNIIAFVGEELALSILGGQIADTYDYDILTYDKLRIDVKTKATHVKPNPKWPVSLPALNITQHCDYYAFVRVRYDYSEGYWLGVFPAKQFTKKATFYPKGTVAGSNKFKFRCDTYNLPIEYLREHI